MPYPSTYNNLIREWFNNPSNLINNDPFLAGNKILSSSPYFDAMPEPMLGDIDDNIAVMLNLNPGFNNGKGKYPPDNVVMSRNKMKPLVQPDYETYATPFPHLCVRHTSASDWWFKRQEWLEKLASMYDNTYKPTYTTDGFPVLKPVALELCPYHSKNWKEVGINTFDQKQRAWIENNPLAVASEAVKHSKLPFIISIGKPVYDATKQLGFKEVKRWSSSVDSTKWPQINGKDIRKTFVVMVKKIDDRTTLIMLNIWSMYQCTPSKAFDPVLNEIMNFIKTLITL